MVVDPRRDSGPSIGPHCESPPPGLSSPSFCQANGLGAIQAKHVRKTYVQPRNTAITPDGSTTCQKTDVQRTARQPGLPCFNPSSETGKNKAGLAIWLTYSTRGQCQNLELPSSPQSLHVSAIRDGGGKLDLLWLLRPTLRFRATGHTDHRLLPQQMGSAFLAPRLLRICDTGYVFLESLQLLPRLSHPWIQMRNRCCYLVKPVLQCGHDDLHRLHDEILDLQPTTDVQTLPTTQEANNASLIRQQHLLRRARFLECTPFCQVQLHIFFLRDRTHSSSTNRNREVASSPTDQAD